MKANKVSNFTGIGLDKDGEINEAEFRQFLQYIPLLDSDTKKLFNLVQGKLSLGSAGNLRPGENIFGQWVTVADTGTANVEFVVPHTLQMESIRLIPGNYLVTYRNKGGVVYDSGTTWTTSNVYLKCSVANARLNIFLMR